MRLLKPLITFALCLSLPVVAFAHSGKTDSDGGHYDRSTGEYHYHHGYSAHQHHDMDGDGDLDCPYEFEDKTDHQPNSQTEQPKQQDENHSHEITSTKPSEEKAHSSESTKDNWGFDDYITFAFVGWLVLGIAVDGVSRIVDAIKRKQKTKRN